MTIWLTSSQLRCVNPSLDYLWLVYLAFCHINNSVLVPLPWSRKSKSRSHLESVDAAGVAGVGDGLSRTHGGIPLGDGHDCAGRCGWRGCTSQLAVNKVSRIWKALIILPHLAFIARITHFIIRWNTRQFNFILSSDHHKSQELLDKRNWGLFRLTEHNTG